ncbi:MAG: hypothetical protein AB8C46_05750 [Burkholderiaceae bacterium]
MRTEKIMIATAIVAAISACGGGGDEASTQTGSNQQSRTAMTPEVSISFVRAAASKSVEVDYFDRFLLPWAPADTSTGAI